MPEAEHIVVVGAMGSGKTTLARALAEALERELFDSDLSIQDRTGRSGREIAERDGVEALHRLEKEVLLEPLKGPSPAVVAAAASVIEDPGVRDALQCTFCVWVTADPDILAERAARGPHRRPVGKSEHLERRDPLFQQVADLVVDTGVHSEREALDTVLGAMGEGQF
ncbi:MAG: shikimate kinase [Acidimicrobiia bacterium]